eukprot:jgi/Psemu1/316252/fgenesh1_kg.3036_\
MERSIEANGGDDGKGESAKDGKSCITNSDLGKPFRPFIETTRTPWHEIEQKYYVLNKEILEEQLNTWEKTRVDMSLLEHRIRSTAAALEVEKDQRRAMEDLIYARLPSSEDSEIESENVV